MSAADLLVSAWDERDRRYVNRRSTGYGDPALSDAEAQAVRVWRTQEIESLSPDLQSKARSEFANWQVPTFTSVRY